MGILGTQPSKQICGLLSALSAPKLRFISCEHQSAVKTAFKFNLVLYGGFFHPEQSLLICWLMKPWRCKHERKKESRHYILSKITLPFIQKEVEPRLRQSRTLTVPLQTVQMGQEEKAAYKRENALAAGWWMMPRWAGSSPTFSPASMNNWHSFRAVEREAPVVNGDVYQTFWYPVWEEGDWGGTTEELMTEHL